MKIKKWLEFIGNACIIVFGFTSIENKRGIMRTDSKAIILIGSVGAGPAWTAKMIAGKLI